MNKTLRLILLTFNFNCLITGDWWILLFSAVGLRMKGMILDLDDEGAVQGIGVVFVFND